MKFVETETVDPSKLICVNIITLGKIAIPRSEGASRMELVGFYIPFFISVVPTLVTGKFNHL